MALISVMEQVVLIHIFYKVIVVLHPQIIIMIPDKSNCFPRNINYMISSTENHSKSANESKASAMQET